MPIPKVLPRTLTAPLNKSLMIAVLTYCDVTDVTKSRLIQRAVERELIRQMRFNTKLKLKIEKAQLKYGTTTSDNRK